MNVNEEGIYHPELNKNVILSCVEIVNTIFGHQTKKTLNIKRISRLAIKQISRLEILNEKNIKHLTQILGPKF